MHPGLRLLEGHRVIIRADIDNVILAKKVNFMLHPYQLNGVLYHVVVQN